MRKMYIVPLILIALCFTGVKASAYEILNETIEHDGKVRKFTVFVPDGLSDVPVSLVLTLHGGGGNAETAMCCNSESRWLELAELNKFIVIFPEGWLDTKGQSCCFWNDCRSDDPLSSVEDDVGFIKRVIGWAEANFQIDPDRIYANGLSNGGFMVFRLAAELSGRFAAMAAVCSSLPAHSECNPIPESMPVLLMNGTADPLMPYEGGCLGIFCRSTSLPVEETVAFWVALNQTDATPTVHSLQDIVSEDNSTVMVYQYANGYKGSEVYFYKIEGGGHLIPGPTPIDPATKSFYGPKNRDIVGAYEMWNFFARHIRRSNNNDDAPPIAQNDGPVEVAKNRTGIAIPVLENDSDPENDQLTVVGVSQPDKGMASVITGCEQVYYSPHEDFTGTDSFEYFISDGHGNVSYAKVLLLVRENAAPVADTQTVSTVQAVPLQIALTAKDPDGDAVTFFISSIPHHGVLAGNYPNLTYYPDREYSGNDSFEFRATDSLGDWGTATINILIIPNAPPVAIDQTVITARNKRVAITLTGTDAEGDAITYLLGTLPKHGILSATYPDLTYYPLRGFEGNDSFDFYVIDAYGAYDLGTISITVGSP